MSWTTKVSEYLFPYAKSHTDKYAGSFENTRNCKNVVRTNLNIEQPKGSDNCVRANFVGCAERSTSLPAASLNMVSYTSNKERTTGACVCERRRGVKCQSKSSRAHSSISECITDHTEAAFMETCYCNRRILEPLPPSYMLQGSAGSAGSIKQLTTSTLEGAGGFLVEQNCLSKNMGGLPRTPFPKAVNGLYVSQEMEFEVAHDAGCETSSYDCTSSVLETALEDDCKLHGERVNDWGDCSEEDDDNEEGDDDEDEDQDEDEDEDDIDESQPMFLSPCVFLNDYPHRQPRAESFIPTHNIRRTSEELASSEPSAKTTKKRMPRTPMPQTNLEKRHEYPSREYGGNTTPSDLVLSCHHDSPAFVPHSPSEYFGSMGLSPNCSVEFELNLGNSKMLNRRKLRNGRETGTSI